MRLKTTLYILLLCFNVLFSQEKQVPFSLFINELIDRYNYTENESIDWETYYDELEELYNNPINLNSAGFDELKKIPFLNYYQIVKILDYRKGGNDILSIYELLYLKGFNEQDIDILQFFVYAEKIDRPEPLDQGLFKYSDHEFIGRAKRTLEEQKGYKTVPDSILNINPDHSRYLGRPEGYYMRYKLNFGKTLGACFIAENDQGEEFFKGSNTQGFDFYSFNINYSDPKRFVQKIVLGDYKMNLGQGLLIWNGFSLGKIPGSLNLAKRSTEISPNTSSAEYNFLRGSAIKIGKGKFAMLNYASTQKLDASFHNNSPDTFKTIYTSGLHRTPLDIQKEKLVSMNTYGSSVLYSSINVKLGANLLYTEFDKPRKPDNNPYNHFDFKGNSILGTSVNYRFLIKNMQLFGETAYSNHGFASINGVLLFLSSQITASAVYRNYAPKFHSIYSNPIAENNTIHNEKGMMAGVDIKWNRNWIKAYGDIFSFPWLRFQTDGPSKGYDIYLELGKRDKGYNTYVRFKKKNKESNHYSDTIGLILLNENNKENLRLNSKYLITERRWLQTRIEISGHNTFKNHATYGFLVFQDFAILNVFNKLDFIIRLAYFDIENSDNRIYAYENSPLYNFGIYQHTKTGMRGYLLLKAYPTERISVWLKIGGIIFRDNTVGSQLEETDSNHKTDMNLQVRIKF